MGVAPAAGLQGDALRAWIAAADNALFGCQNCCTQAQLTPPVVSVRGAEGGASALTADFSGNTQDSRFASRLLGGAPYL
ncbi:hypothetical protein BLL52_2841 [Rhodoferax antarcticus ANT.BR]|uniref:Uncharacterized protein n=1 Tax=Rhodoferax antarcticus ANT.BR TaxID=1111071 RepID=A0A1Q8YF47_9BURK|nr:hypothetical protein BLL52_2841 [Rhodoferax antarcticus ANT.BR]